MGKKVTREYSPVSWGVLMQYENLPLELEGYKKGGWVVTMKKSMDTFQHLKEGNNRSEALATMAVNIPASSWHCSDSGRSATPGKTIC